MSLESDMARRGRIEVEQDDNGAIIISDNVTLNYGHGKTFIEAVGDYHDTLREWWLLTADERKDHERGDLRTEIPGRLTDMPDETIKEKGGETDGSKEMVHE